jgi:aflatoxin B1 aldehyde reductase
VQRNLADGKYEIDTARDYTNGRTEALLGRVMPENLYIGTKINAFGNGGKSLDAPSVHRQINEVLAALKVTSVDLLYLHAPDYTTPIEQTIRSQR